MTQITTAPKKDEPYEVNVKNQYIVKVSTVVRSFDSRLIIRPFGIVS